MNFGQLVARLRTERALTQSELAAATRVSDSTISKAERTAACKWRRTTALEVFRVLDAAAPIDQPTAEAYFKAARMSITLSVRQSIEQMKRTAEDTKRDYPELGAFAFRNRFQSLLRDEARLAAHWQLHQLLNALGPEAVIGYLDGLADARKVGLIPLPPPVGGQVRTGT
jgi:DNA-binding XRE family transcriptional regulator